MPDVNPLDPSSPVGQLRLLISDSQLRTDPGNPSAAAAYYFPDTFLQGFLSINGQNLKWAAADALTAFAANETLVSKKIRKENLQTDGPAVAAELRRAADAYRVQGNHTQELVDGVDGTFAVVDFADPVTTYDTYEARVGIIWH